MACTHPQLDFIAKIAESSTGYSVVGKANSSNLHMAVNASFGKKVKARGRP